MAIRLKKQVWDVIRAEYQAGATALDLVAKYGLGLNAASIRSRAWREKWGRVSVPSRFAADRALVEGITLDAATDLEAIDRTLQVQSNRAAATLGSMLSDGMSMACMASKQGNAELAQSAESLIAAAQSASAALILKIEVDRVAFDIGGTGMKHVDLVEVE